MYINGRFFERAKGFVARNARPLDYARWNFHFGKGSAEEILEILSAYQNPDGGFGHAVEPDFWNPASTPVGVWAAAKILREIGFSDSSHPVVAGMLAYLASGKDFIEDSWCFTVPSNNGYPHAAWWQCVSKEGVPSENPTAGLAGFLLTHAEKGSILYRRAQGIALKSIYKFLKEQPRDVYVLRSYLELLADCEKLTDFRTKDVNLFRTKLYRAISAAVENGGEESSCKPSHFFEHSGRIFKIVGMQPCKKEAEECVRSQLPDGSLPVPWQWWTEYKEAEIALHWWKSSMLIDALLFMKALT